MNVNNLQSELVPSFSNCPNVHNGIKTPAPIFICKNTITSNYNLYFNSNITKLQSLVFM